MSANRRNRQWFAIRVKTGREAYARGQYERQGYSVYLPEALQRCSHAGRVKWEVRPFFPGYLFLHLAPEEQRWTSINSTYGAIRAVCFGSLYPPVPDEVVDALKARHGSDGLISLQRSRWEAPFQHGQKVRVLSGVMSDIEGVFQCMKGRDRVVLLMHLLGRQSRVEFPLDLVA